MTSFLIALAIFIAQTRVDLKNQAKDVDFTNFASTKPAKTGTALPAACAPGELFFNLSSPGAGLYTCASTNVWTQGSPNFAKPFSGVTSLSILGSEHNQGTANLIVSCWDGASPANWIEPGGVQVDPATFNVTVTFTAAQSGKCVVTGTSGIGGSGSGGSGGPITVSQLPNGIPAAKIAAGTVSDAAFGALSNVTSDLQAQINGKAALNHVHIGGGDLSGDVTNTAVVGLQRVAVSNVTPLNGQALVFNAGAGQWQPQAVAGGAGGASTASQLTDLTVTFTSGSVLTIGSGCSNATPCNLRFGTTVISILTSATVTISGSGSGPAFFYVTSDGTLNAGSNTLSLACSSTCAAQTGVTQYPLNSIPLASWNALNGLWMSGGGTDRRAFQSTSVLAGGTGIALVSNGTQTTVAVDPAVVPTFLTNAAALTFGTVANLACSGDFTLSLPGAATGDSVAPGWPALPAGVLGMSWISAANTAAVRLCNFSGATQSFSNLTIRATVVRGL